MLWLKFFRPILRICGIFVIAATIVVLSQDIQIFPGVFRSVPDSGPPAGTEQFIVETEDGEKIVVWYKQGQPGQKLSGYSAVIMHGNFETVYSSTFLQNWLGSLGISTYTFDYRGYGNSSGWPSEKGVYLDSKAVWEAVQKKEGKSSNEMIIFGVSIGTGIAAQLASQIDPKVLVLVAPYADIPSVVAQRFYLRPLIPLLWYEFPTMKYLESLNNACLVLAHGEKDNIIDFSNSQKLHESVKTKLRSELIAAKDASHNDIFRYTMPQIAEALERCVN